VYCLLSRNVKHDAWMWYNGRPLGLAEVHYSRFGKPVHDRKSSSWKGNQSQEAETHVRSRLDLALSAYAKEDWGQLSTVPGRNTWDSSGLPDYVHL